MTTDPIIILAVSLSIVTAALLALAWRLYLLINKVNSIHALSVDTALSAKEYSRRIRRLENVAEDRAQPKRFKAAE
jgi:hypothetical protein